MMKRWLSNPFIWLWVVPAFVLAVSISAVRHGLVKWQDSATMALSAIAALFAWLGARSQLARPRLCLYLSPTQKRTRGVFEVHIRDEEALIQPVLENRGDRVAERKFIEFSFPPELEPTVKAKRYQPPGGMIREITPELYPDGENPGRLAGWVNTVIFPGAGLTLDQIHLKPVVGEHRVHFRINFDHGKLEGHVCLKLMYEVALEGLSQQDT